MENDKPQRVHRPRPIEAGAFIIDKSPDWTSHDVVSLIRRRYGFKKVGHCGTLDPGATGVLVIVVGKATKLSMNLTGQDKVYHTELILGSSTDSYDASGKVTEESDFSHVNEKQIHDCIESFVGPQEQIPPMVSAIKKNGKKLYELARQGIEIEREARPITIHSITDTEIALPSVKFLASCSKGTYIRSLCHDMGLKLGTHGHMGELRRTQSGQFTLERSLTPEQIKEMEIEDILPYLIPYEKLEEFAQK